MLLIKKKKLLSSISCITSLYQKHIYLDCITEMCPMLIGMDLACELFQFRKFNLINAESIYCFLISG